jgi:hypothetical protein
MVDMEAPRHVVTVTLRDGNERQKQRSMGRS